MSIRFTPDDWKRIRETYAAWWKGELDRPLVQCQVSGICGSRISALQSRVSMTELMHANRKSHRNDHGKEKYRIRKKPHYKHIDLQKYYSASSSGGKPTHTG